MSIKSMNKDELKNTAMLDLAILILQEEKKAMDFHDIYEKIVEFKGYSTEQKEELFAQFYTDLNVDGQFLTLGSNMWGLKRWYPVEQIDEEITAEPKKKKTKKKKTTKKKKQKDDLDIDYNANDKSEDDYESFENHHKDDFNDMEDEDDPDEEDYDDDYDEEDELDSDEADDDEEEEDKR